MSSKSTPQRSSLNYRFISVTNSTTPPHHPNKTKNRNYLKVITVPKVPLPELMSNRFLNDLEKLFCLEIDV